MNTKLIIHELWSQSNKFFVLSQWLGPWALCSPLTLQMMTWWLNQNLITHLRSAPTAGVREPARVAWLRRLRLRWLGWSPGGPGLLWLNTDYLIPAPASSRTPGPDTDKPHGLHHPMSQAWAHPGSHSITRMCAKEEFQWTPIKGCDLKVTSVLLINDISWTFWY